MLHHTDSVIAHLDMLTTVNMHQHACTTLNMQGGIRIINLMALLINVNGVFQNYIGISLHSNHLDFMPLSAGGPVNCERGELQ